MDGAKIDTALEEWDWQEPHLRKDGSIDKGAPYFTLRVLSVDDEAAIEDELVEFIIDEGTGLTRKRYRTGSQTLAVLDRGLVKSHNLTYAGKPVTMQPGDHGTYRYLDGNRRIRVANAITLRSGFDESLGE